jgi:hypothetical protein
MDNHCRAIPGSGPRVLESFAQHSSSAGSVLPQLLQLADYVGGYDGFLTSWQQFPAWAANFGSPAAGYGSSGSTGGGDDTSRGGVARLPPLAVQPIIFPLAPWSAIAIPSRPADGRGGAIPIPSRPADGRVGAIAIPSRPADDGRVNGSMEHGCKGGSGNNVSHGDERGGGRGGGVLVYFTVPHAAVEAVRKSPVLPALVPQAVFMQ